ncbi:sialin isoform X2 [Anabrus simplex]
MAHLGFFNVFALRVNVSVGIVAMTSSTWRILENGTKLEEPAEFDWDTKQQGLILGSYYYGYITTQLLGGWLAARIGGNRLFGIGIAVTSLFTLLTPLLARVSIYWFIAIRVIEGIFEGVSFPSMHDVWAHWAPPLERSRLASFAYSGCYLGTVIVMPLSGVLAHNIGWPAVFYVFGVVGLLWFAAWWVLVKRGPQYDRCIDARELKYIQDSLGTSQENIVHPWKKFFTSGSVWAAIVANVSENWGFLTLITQLPLFMKDVLQFDVQEAGFLSALPYLAVAITLQVAGVLADWILSRKMLSITNVRKIFICGAFICQCTFMLLAAFLLTPSGAITCLTLAVGLGAFATSGFFVNYLDIAPQHASVLLGIGNTFGSLPGIISPTITGFIVQNKMAHEWQIIFYIASAIYLAGALFYGLFGSGEVQSWAKIRHEETVNEDTLQGCSNKAYEK